MVFSWMIVTQKNSVDILELTIIQHTLNVLVHMVIYVYIRIAKSIWHMICCFMGSHIEQSAHQ